MPIQGTASDIVKIAMLHVAEEFKRANLKARLLMQVHDELLVERSRKRKRASCGNPQARDGVAVQLDVPLVVDVGWLLIIGWMPSLVLLVENPL